MVNSGQVSNKKNHQTKILSIFLLIILLHQLFKLISLYKRALWGTASNSRKIREKSTTSKVFYNWPEF
jgi:hypothetical protein